MPGTADTCNNPITVSKLSELEDRLAALGAATREGFADRAAELRAAADRLENGDDAARDEIRRLAHKLRGVAGSAGRPDLTDRAARLEDAAKSEASPLAIAEGARRLAAATERDASSAPKRRESGKMSKREPLGWRVVALDDESSTRRLLEITLVNVGGCDAEVHESAENAMRAVTDAPPDLVIVDAMMPEVTGLTFLSGVRRKVGPIPVVILSAATPEELGWTLPDDPQLAWMRKPFRPAALLDELRSFLERCARSAV